MPTMISKDESRARITIKDAKTTVEYIFVFFEVSMSSAKTIEKTLDVTTNKVIRTKSRLKVGLNEIKNPKSIVTNTWTTDDELERIFVQ